MNTRTLANATAAMALPLLLAACGTNVQTPSTAPTHSPVVSPVAPVTPDPIRAPLAITPVSRELSATPIPVIAGGHTVVYGEAEVALRAGGSATLELVNAKGVPAAGLILMAGDPTAATRFVPCGPSASAPVVDNTASGVAGWHCDVAIVGTAELRLEVISDEGGAKVVFAEQSPADGTGWVMNDSQNITTADLSAGLVVIGTNATLTGIAGEVDQTPRSQTDLER